MKFLSSSNHVSVCVNEIMEWVDLFMEVVDLILVIFYETYFPQILYAKRQSLHLVFILEAKVGKQSPQLYFRKLSCVLDVTAEKNANYNFWYVI